MMKHLTLLSASWQQTSSLHKRQMPHSAQGLTLVELLIALGLGVFILIGIISLLISVSHTRVEVDKTSEQIENGRYALQLLSDDLRNAGFYGVPQPLAEINTVPNPCNSAATIIANDFGYIAAKIKIPVPVFGYASGSPLPTTCLSNPQPNSEALVIHQVGTTPVTVASLGNSNTAPHVQISANTAIDSQTLKVGKTTNDFTALPQLHKKDGSLADVRPYSVRTYYLSSCDNCAANDGIPTLKVAELVNGAVQVTSLVEGIEDIHFDYGIDLIGSDGTSATQDGAPDCYVSDPGVATAPASCTLGTWTAASPNNWVNVTSVRIHLLARGIKSTATWTDTRSYDLGRAARSGPFNDNFKRQVFTLVVAIRNVSGARE